MGNAAIYWYPEDGGPLVDLDLGESLSDMQVERPRYVETSEGTDPSVVDYGGHERVRVILERFSSRTTAAALYSLETHLQAGKPISVTADSAKTWAGYALTGGMKGGRTGFDVGGNVFAIYESVGTLSSGDWVVIHDANPGLKLEEMPISSHVGGSMAFTGRTRYAYNTGNVFIRWEHFYPIAYMAPGQFGRPIVTSDHRRNYTLDLTLITSPRAVQALYTETGGLGFNGLWGDGTPKVAGGTLQEIINDRLRSTSATGAVLSGPTGTFGV